MLYGTAGMHAEPSTAQTESPGQVPQSRTPPQPSSSGPQAFVQTMRFVHWGSSATHSRLARQVWPLGHLPHTIEPPQPLLIVPHL